ncbi:MAG: hypothetical protein ACE5Q6_11450 [Dehalococcoidia bacterium]
MTSRTCSFHKPDGQRCRAAPLIDQELCFMHSPEHAEEAAEARRLGGYRRRREAAVVGAFDLEGLDSLAVLQRVLEIALLDTLGLDNSLNRSRTLGYLVGIGSRLRQEGEVELRLAALEAAVQGQKMPPDSVFYLEPEANDFSDDAEADDELR